MEDKFKDYRIHKVTLQVKGPFIDSFLKRLFKMHINVSNIRYIGNDNIIFVTNINNVRKIKKSFSDYNISVIANNGIYRLKPFLIRNKVFLISLLVVFILFLFLKNIIVKVNIIHSSKDIRVLLKDELENYGVKRLTFKKSYNQLQKIKNKILEKYPDKLEWIEIESKGMTYNVRVEERILTRIKDENKFCHIIANKSAILTRIDVKQGEKLYDSKDYVSKGDIVISGDIKANEEIKKSVCAKGEVYGEVWYTVDTVIPLKYKEKKKSGKHRINFMYDNQKIKQPILKPHFKNIEVKNKKLFSIFGVDFYIQKEYELIVKNKKYTKPEAIKVAVNKAEAKINLKLNDKERIILQKVLKTEQKNSKMYVEIFVSVEENIGATEHYELQENNSSLE